MDLQLIDRYMSNHMLKVSKYQKMLDYYEGRMDILSNYEKINSRSNFKIVSNYVGKMVDVEIGYVVGKPLNYLSKSGDSEAVNRIDYHMSHWSKSHDQQLLQTAEIFGESYELAFINSEGEFSTKIISPMAGFPVTANNELLYFVHYFQMYDLDTEIESDIYCDIYDAGYIYHFKRQGSGLTPVAEPDSHIFGRVPVSICHVEGIIYDKIKLLNDAYNIAVSDCVNSISDFRNAYLLLTGITVESEDEAKKLNSNGIIILPDDKANAEFLTKNINDAFLQNTILKLQDDMYKQCNMIDNQQMPSSNTSGIALRSRLIELELRSDRVAASLIDAVTNRLKLLGRYLAVKSDIRFEYKDIKVKYTANVPVDLTSIAQMISQIGDILDLETKLSLLPFVDNPALIASKVRAEQESQLIGNELLNNV